MILTTLAIVVFVVLCVSMLHKGLEPKPEVYVASDVSMYDSSGNRIPLTAYDILAVRSSDGEWLDQAEWGSVLESGSYDPVFSARNHDPSRSDLSSF